MRPCQNSRDRAPPSISRSRSLSRSASPRVTEPNTRILSMPYIFPIFASASLCARSSASVTRRRGAGMSTGTGASLVAWPHTNDHHRTHSAELSHRPGVTHSYGWATTNSPVPWPTSARPARRRSPTAPGSPRSLQWTRARSSPFSTWNSRVATQASRSFPSTPSRAGWGYASSPNATALGRFTAASSTPRP